MKVIDIQSVVKTYKLVLLQEKLLWFIYFFLEILHSGSFVFLVLMTQQLFDSLEESIRGRAALSVFISVLAVFGSSLVSQLLNGITNYLIPYISGKVTGKLSIAIQQKVNRLGASDYECSERLDTIQKAKDSIKSACELTQATLSVIGFYIPYFIFMSFYLYINQSNLILSVFFVFVPVMVGQFVKAKYSYDLEDEIARIKRRSLEYEKTLTNVRYVKETKIMGAWHFFYKQLRDSLVVISSKNSQNNRKRFILSLLLSLISLTGYIILLIMLFISLIKGDISIGAFGAIFSSIEVMFIIMDEMITYTFGRISEHSGLIIHLDHLFNLPEHSGNTAVKSRNNDDSIILKNVNFQYPQSSIEVLKNISITIKKGEHVALVGSNGSGKSTLVKLIMGLYQPTRGSILINGYDTKVVESDTIFEQFSVVFQEFNRYKMTLRENIELSDKNKFKSFEQALDKANFVKPDGLSEDTVLSREFGGIDLSGGQWQKIAIARSYYRDREVVILDEPTSAIDPIEEANLYHQFFALSRDRTSIIVTHRLGSVTLADKIILLENGEVIAQGTHNELLKDATYHHMWQSQAKWYARGEM